MPTDSKEKHSWHQVSYSPEAPRLPSIKNVSSNYTFEAPQEQQVGRFVMIHPHTFSMLLPCKCHVEAVTWIFCYTFDEMHARVQLPRRLR